MHMMTIILKSNSWKYHTIRTLNSSNFSFAYRRNRI